MIPKTITERIDSTDRGVSPVIGVILMVAITVILAAVIGTFVLDLGQSAGNSAPSASLTVSADADGNFTVAHKGGDSLVGSNTRIQVTDESSGNTATFENSSDDVFSVGGTLVLNTSTTGTGTNSITSDSTVWETTSNTGQEFTISSGSQYSVQLIDTESQRVIFETTITA